VVSDESNETPGWASRIGPPGTRAVDVKMKAAALGVEPFPWRTNWVLG
jgi:hypothetical protein